MDLLREISTNAGLDAVLVLLCSFLPYSGLRLRYQVVVRVAVGAGFGLMAIVSMQFPVTILPGVIIDSRTVLTTLSGAYFGPWAALSCLIVACVYRSVLGGVGVMTGLVILVLAAALGVAYERLSKRIKANLVIPALLLLGVTLGVLSVCLTLTLPEEVRFTVFFRTLVPVPIAYSLLTCLFGGLLFVVLARKEGEFQLKQSLEEKKLLLRELYHRTKNNMALIVSFLRMAGSRLDDQRLHAILDQAEGRIQAMALVHQKLYESRNLSHVDLQEYLESLVAVMPANHPPRAHEIRFDRKLQQYSVAIDTAIPFGLVVHELVSNAVKYAFPEHPGGTITIDLWVGSKGEVCLRISDNGIGFPREFSPDTDGDMGLEVVRSIIRQQLRGTIELTSAPNNGVSCLVMLPAASGTGR